MNANRFFRWPNDEGTLGRGQCYVEFAPFEGDWVALRQIETDGQTFLTSNLPTQFLGLCDQPLSRLRLTDSCLEIGHEEFEAVWTRAMFVSTESWQQFKRTHGVGETMTGRALCFYPQGVLVEIDAPCSFFRTLGVRRVPGAVRQSRPPCPG